MCTHDQQLADSMVFFDCDARKGKRNLAALSRPRPDASFKEYWRDDSHFSDMINAYFYGGKKEVLPKELSVVDSVVLTAEDRLSVEGIPDVVRCLTRTGPGGEIERWIFFLENQMYLDRGMVMRVRFNTALIARQEWRQLRDAHKDNRKQDPPFLSSVGEDVVVPGISGLVIYYGSQPWDMPTKPSDLMSPGVLIPRPEAVIDQSINIFCAATQQLPFHNPDNIALFKAIRARNENLPVAEKTRKIRDILLEAPKAARNTYLQVWGSRAMREALAKGEGDDNMVLALLERDYEEIREMNRTIRDLSSENKDLSSENKDLSSENRDLKTVQRDYAQMLLSEGHSIAEVAAKTHLTPEEVEMLSPLTD